MGRMLDPMPESWDVQDWTLEQRVALAVVDVERRVEASGVPATPRLLHSVAMDWTDDPFSLGGPGEFAEILQRISLMILNNA